MAARTTTKSGNASDATVWDGSAALAENDSITIGAGHSVVWDLGTGTTPDTRTWTTNGVAGIVITGHATTPGELVAKYSAAGDFYLPIKTGTTISGTTVGGGRGRLIANSDGTFAGTTALPFDRKFVIEFMGTAGTAKLNAADLDVRLFCTEPTTGCPWMEYTQSSVDAGTDTITLASNHNWRAGKAVRVKATTTVPGGLAASTTYYVLNPSGATLQLAATVGGAAINLTDSGTGTVQYYEYLPGIVRTYKSLKTVSSINTTTNVITLTGAHGWSANTAVMARSSGLLPAGVKANTMYYVGSPSGADLKLLAYSSGTEIDITDSGSGTIELYDGHTDTATKVLNVLDDVTGDAAWTNVASHNRVVLCDAGSAVADRQADTMATIAAGAITITAANVDSAQYPNSLICLVSRNITIKSNSTSGTYIVDHTTATFGGNVFQCEVLGTGAAGYAYSGTGVGTGHTVAGSISGTDYGISGVVSPWVINATICAVNRGLNTCTSCTVNGPVSGCTYGLNACTSCIVNGPVSGCTNGIYSCTSCTINGPVSGCTNGLYSCTSCTVNGPVSGCAQGCSSSTSNIVNGPVSGCTYGVRYGSVFLTRLAVFSGNSYDLYQVAYLEGYGGSLGSTNQNGTAAQNFTTPNDNGQINVIYDMGTSGTPSLGRVRAWTAGGNTSTIESASLPASPPVALDYGYKMLGESSAAGGQRENFVDIPLWGKKDTALTISIYEICNANPSTFTTGPTFELLDPDYLYGEAAAILDSATAQADGADDTSWHTLTLSYTPASDRPLILRARMKDTAKYFHWACSVAGGGYTYGDASAAKVLTTATGAGTYQAVAASAVQKGVAVGVSPAVGTLEGIIDSAAAVTTVGCLVSGTRYATGTVSGAGAYNATGVIYGAGSYATEASRNTDPGVAYVLAGNDYTILGVAKTAAYAPDFPAVGNVYNDTVNGAAGTLTLANTQYVLSSAPDYGVAGTGGAKTATLAAAGNVLTGSGAFGVNGTSVTPSYSPDFPDVGNVTTTDTVNGSAGTLNMGLYTLISGVVLPATGEVDAPVAYGYTGNMLEGTGVNSTTLLSALGLGTGNLDNQLDKLNTIIAQTLDTYLRSSVGLTADNLEAMILAVPTAVQNADGLLNRNIEGGADGGRTVKQALYKLRNKWWISAGLLHVCDTIDVDTWQETLTSDPTGDPLVGATPT